MGGQAADRFFMPDSHIYVLEDVCPNDLTIIDLELWRWGTINWVNWKLMGSFWNRLRESL